MKKVWIAGCLGWAVAGCSGGGRDLPDTVDVSGVVLLDGQPVEGIEVNFMVDDFAGYGKTDREGKFQLVQGAVPGPNKVFFSKIEGGNVAIDPAGGMDEGQLQAMAMAQRGRSSAQVPHQVIPAAYSDPQHTKIAFNVPEGGAEAVEFKLTSK